MVRDAMFGLLAIGVGAAVCARGYVAMRMIIPIWGAFAGFVLGAGLVAGIGTDDFLGTVAGWIVGTIVAAVFALCAYTYFEVSVALGLAAVGFTLGTTLMVAVGVTWSWLVVLAGVVCGALLAVVAIVSDLPMLLLIGLTTLAGSSAVVSGIMLLAGVVDTTDLDSPSTTERIDDDWWWYAAFLVIATIGMFVQVRNAGARRSVREAWRVDGGRQFRRAQA